MGWLERWTRRPLTSIEPRRFKLFVKFEFIMPSLLPWAGSSWLAFFKQNDRLFCCCFYRFSRNKKGPPTKRTASIFVAIDSHDWIRFKWVFFYCWSKNKWNSFFATDDSLDLKCFLRNKKRVHKNGRIFSSSLATLDVGLIFSFWYCRPMKKPFKLLNGLSMVTLLGFEAQGCIVNGGHALPWRPVVKKKRKRKCVFFVLSRWFDEQVLLLLLIFKNLSLFSLHSIRESPLPFPFAFLLIGRNKLDAISSFQKKMKSMKKKLKINAIEKKFIPFFPKNPVKLGKHRNSFFKKINKITRLLG